MINGFEIKLKTKNSRFCNAINKMIIDYFRIQREELIELLST